VDAAYHVHKSLGPGLLESVYETVLVYELKRRGLKVGRQAPVAIVYDNIKLDEGFRADLIVEDKVIVELKSVENVIPAYIPHSFEYLSSYFLRCTLAGSWVGEDHLTDSECQEVVFLGLGKAGLQ